MKLYKEYLNNFSESDLQKYFGMMTDKCKASVMRYKSPRDRKRTVAGERLARLALSEYFGISEQDIEFERTENGKPYAKGLDINFSVSHSKELVVCAVSKRELGVDTELIRPVNSRVARFACTEKDLEFLFDEDIPDAEIILDEKQTIRFFKLWTAKEAYVKSIGTGISDLKKFDYSDIEPFCMTEISDGYIITVYIK